MPIRPSASYVHRSTTYPLIIAEIGVRDAGNAVEMFRDMRVGRLYLIDNYLPYQDGNNKFFTQKEQDDLYVEMFRKIKNHLDKVVLVSKESTFASKLFENYYFDYIYIDCCHDREAVKADIDSWWIKVKGGGFMGGHDYSMYGVQISVGEFVAQNNLNLITDMEEDWLIQKP